MDLCTWGQLHECAAFKQTWRIGPVPAESREETGSPRSCLPTGSLTFSFLFFFSVLCVWTRICVGDKHPLVYEQEMAFLAPPSVPVLEQNPACERERLQRSDGKLWRRSRGVL